MPVDPKRVEALFAAALERPASERAEFLDKSCGDDAPLRERVERLIHAYSQAGQFLQEPAGPMGDSAVLDTPTEAFDTDRPSRQADASVPTQAEALKPAAHIDLSFLSPSQQPGSLGRLAHYEVHAVLGKGGFGTVFKAFDELLHRVVAIKVLAPEMAASAAARQRFLREARAAAAVRHEHVVGIHAVAREDEPLPYLVMEYVNGQTLQAKLDQTGPLEVKEILRIGLQIAGGLEAAHKHGKVHRDIKPANILLENGIEHVKITDFGLARAVDDASVTQSGVVSGTPMYMSPEQAEGLALDHRSDLFSVGTVLYVMCTGRPPFRASGSIAVLKRVVEEKPRAIREINSEIPQWLCDVVEKLHAKKPEDRYQSAKEVADVLAKNLAEIQLHGGVGGQAASLSKPVQAGSFHGGQVAASEALHSTPQPATKPQPSGGRWLFVFPLLGIMGMLAWGFGPHLLLTARNKGIFIFHVDDPQVEVVLKREGAKSALSHKGAGRIEVVPGTYAVQIRPRPGHVLASLQYAQDTLFSTRYVPFHPHELKEVYIGRGDYVQIAISLKPADAPAAKQPGWVQLFNGTSLDGWKKHPDDPTNVWTVEDGAIVARGGTSYLFSERGDFENFHLRAQAKINPAGDAGVIFRTAFAIQPTKQRVERDSGYEAQIGVRTSWPVHTGSLTWTLGQTAAEAVLKQGPPNPHRPDEWFLLEIIARGPDMQTLVNGQPTAQYRDATEQYRRGHLALQSWGLNLTTVHFKKIEIKELPPADVEELDRFVARWALEAGGSVAIRVDKADARTSITDAAALPAGNFTVEAIDLSKSRGTTEATLGTLAGAKGLRELVLRDLPIGDGGLPQLQTLGKLEKLDLTGTKVTDRALVFVSEMRSLKSLVLESTAVGDGALRQLEETKQLERLQGLMHLNVRKTALTAAGGQALAKALPKCTIVSDHP